MGTAEDKDKGARHRVVLEFDGGLCLRLICPESGCSPAQYCGECYRNIDDDEREPCDSCPRPEDTECWLKSWFDNSSYDELLSGEVTVEVDVEWDGDHVNVEIANPAPA
jgi:hypothetical protein